MDIYFILWFIIQYYFIFLIKLFQLWPLDSQWFLCSFDISPSLSAFFFFSTSSLIDTTKCSRLIVCNSCPGLKINHFSKEPFLFIRKSYQKSRSGLQVCLLLHEYLYFFTYFRKFITFIFIRNQINIIHFISVIYSSVLEHVQPKYLCEMFSYMRDLDT